MTQALTTYPVISRVTDRDFLHLLKAWEVFRTKHREIPAQAVTVLLYVASHNPCHKQAIEEEHGVSNASCSRMVSLLSTGEGRKGVKTPGLGLIKAEPDPVDKRRLLLSLTREGEQLVSEVKEVIYS